MIEYRVNRATATVSMQGNHGRTVSNALEVTELDAMSLAVPGDNGMAALQVDVVPREAGPGSVTVEVAGRVVQMRDAAVRSGSETWIASWR